MERKTARRRYALGIWGATWVAVGGVFLVKGDQLNTGLALWVLGVGTIAAIYWIATAQPVVSRVGSITWETQGRSHALRFNPPEGRGKKKLKKETEQLVRDIWEHVQSSPVQEHREVSRAMQAADSENDRSAIWHAYTEQLLEDSERERRANREKFGGRLEYVLREFQRLGWIDESERSSLMWKLGSNHWIQDTASALEALAKKL